jgi:RNA polymerase sigma-70 factor (ECF subfamily)
VSAGLRLEDRIESHRSELNAYCSRMLGSQCDAEDAVQETLLRAWRSAEGFQGRCTLRSWLYRIATNVCIDAAQQRARRPVPTEQWTELHAQTAEPDPAELALAREELRLALVAAVHHLPARQRAVLLLRDILCWRATEVAELLQTSVTAVNSALQRAHATVGSRDPERLTATCGEARRGLVAAYLTAFARDDVDMLTALALGTAPNHG